MIDGHYMRHDHADMSIQINDTPALRVSREHHLILIIRLAISNEPPPRDLYREP